MSRRLSAVASQCRQQSRRGRAERTPHAQHSASRAASIGRRRRTRPARNRAGRRRSYRRDARRASVSSSATRTIPAAAARTSRPNSPARVPTRGAGQPPDRADADRRRARVEGIRATGLRRDGGLGLRVRRPPAPASRQRTVVTRRAPPASPCRCYLATDGVDIDHRELQAPDPPISCSRTGARRRRRSRRRRTRCHPCRGEERTRSLPRTACRRARRPPPGRRVPTARPRRRAGRPRSGRRAAVRSRMISGAERAGPGCAAAGGSGIRPEGGGTRRSRWSAVRSYSRKTASRSCEARRAPGGRSVTASATRRSWPGRAQGYGRHMATDSTSCSASRSGRRPSAASSRGVSCSRELRSSAPKRNSGGTSGEGRASAAGRGAATSGCPSSLSVGEPLRGDQGRCARRAPPAGRWSRPSSRARSWKRRPARRRRARARRKRPP